MIQVWNSVILVADWLSVSGREKPSWTHYSRGTNEDVSQDIQGCNVIDIWRECCGLQQRFIPRTKYA